MSFGNCLTAQGVARPKNPADHHIVRRGGSSDRHPGQGVRHVQLQRRRQAAGHGPRPRDPSVPRRLDGRQARTASRRRCPGPRPGDADRQVLRRRRRRARGAGDRCRAGTRRHVVEARNGPVDPTAGFFDWIRAQKPRNSTTADEHGQRRHGDRERGEGRDGLRRRERRVDVAGVGRVELFREGCCGSSRKNRPWS